MIATTKDDGNEMFPIVDERGNVVGSATRGECHGGSMLLHPVVHLHVFNPRGELYLQLRPKWKDIQPGRWDTAVGGHISLGEGVDEALRREAMEELGLEGFEATPFQPYVFQSDRERELVCPHRTVWDGPITPSAETDGGRFFTLQEIREGLGKGLFTPQFEQEFQRLFGATPKDIRIEDYRYPLTDDRIAKFPLAERDHSKLLVYRQGDIGEGIFHSLPELLPAGSLMVFNNTRVVQARLHFRKQTGAHIEVFILEPAQPVEYQENFAARESCAWLCLVGGLKRWKQGVLERTLDIDGHEVTLSATRGEAVGTSHWVTFRWTGGHTWAEILDVMGELPIPPYLNRETEESDKTTYQTVYSKIEGSVAAPTAGLHFTERVLHAIDGRGIEREEVTLHVGAGTFKPVKSETIGGHEMHTEHIAVNRHTIERLIAHEAKAIAVGTTSVRTLESLYYMGISAQRLMDEGQDTGDALELHVSQWDPYEAARPTPPATEALGSLLRYMDKHGLHILNSSTQIIIAPGYKFHIVRMMVTNFHQPESTLLLLISAFVDGDWRRIYDYALGHGFRFLSYGDSSLLIPRGTKM